MTDFTFNLLMIYLGHQYDNLTQKERQRNIKSLKRIRAEETLTEKQIETIDGIIKTLEHDPAYDDFVADPLGQLTFEYKKDMTQEDLNAYSQYKEEIERLEEQIRIDGDRVTDRIARIQAADGKNHRGSYGDRKEAYIDGEWDWYHCGDDANYAECYRVEGKWCHWWGVSKSYDDCTIYEAGKFEAKRLCMSDEELDAWADQRIAEIKAGIERAKELKRQKDREARELAQKRREEKERAEYERLKKKFEGGGE
jgi:hypothetical protein